MPKTIPKAHQFINIFGVKVWGYERVVVSPGTENNNTAQSVVRITENQFLQLVARQRGWLHLNLY